MATLTKNTIGQEMSAIEKRKVKNWWARVSLSWAIMITFIILLWLLFFTTGMPDGHMQLVNILVGAYVAVLAKSTDYWFKEKDDPEHKETEALQNGH